jgi:hypothetical protein
VTTYADGVRRVHVRSHRNLEKMLVDAGLSEEAAAADVARSIRGASSYSPAPTPDAGAALILSSGARSNDATAVTSRMAVRGWPDD